MRPSALTVALAVLPLLAAGCGGGFGATPTAIVEPMTVLLATTELRPGTQRVAFLLETPVSLVTAPEARVSSYPPAAETPAESASATFHEWPYATRGSYVTALTFNQPGQWRLLVEAEGRKAEVTLEVREITPVVDIGQLAPFSGSKTLASAGGDLSSITSHYAPDPQLYQLSIAEALISGKPSVIVFASPAYCTSPTCGPEVETVSELRTRFQDQADFIHVEVYDNPHEIQGDLGLARLSPVLSEWGIDRIPGYVNESWVFVLGRDGRVTARFQGYATLAELEAALHAAL